MLARCYVPTANRYERYGGRGIYVCERWHNFDNFVRDMYDAFQEHALTNNGDTQLDRQDNNGHYCPENCRWLTGLENRTRSLKKYYLTPARYDIHKRIRGLIFIRYHVSATHFEHSHRSKERWKEAAAAEGKGFHAWIRDTLDAAAIRSVSYRR